MLRTAGSTFPQAASRSSTRVRAISAALSGEGSVVKTSIASVTPAMYGRGAALSKARAYPFLSLDTAAATALGPFRPFCAIQPITFGPPAARTPSHPCMVSFKRPAFSFTWIFSAGSFATMCWKKVIPRSPTSDSGLSVIARTAPGARVSSKSGSFAFPASKWGLPSREWKRKSPGTSVNRTPTVAPFFKEAAARRPASLVSKKRLNRTSLVRISLGSCGVALFAPVCAAGMPRSWAEPAGLATRSRTIRLAGNDSPGSRTGPPRDFAALADQRRERLQGPRLRDGRRRIRDPTERSRGAGRSERAGEERDPHPAGRNREGHLREGDRARHQRAAPFPG